MANPTTGATGAAGPRTRLPADLIPPGCTYIVRKGDTLSSVARRSAVSDDPKAIQAQLEALQAANPELTNETLQPGDTLAIPERGPSVKEAVRAVLADTAEPTPAASSKKTPPKQLPSRPTDPAEALQAAFGKAPTTLTKLDDGRIQFRMPGDTDDRFAFMAVTKTGPQLIEISPDSFAVTADLVRLLDQHAGIKVAAINPSGQGLITEQELWSYFSGDVQFKQHAAFERIEVKLQELHPDLMRFLADGHAATPNSRLANLSPHQGGDLKALVQDTLNEAARAWGKPLAKLTPIERFNVAAIAYAKLGVKYDDIQGAPNVSSNPSADKKLIETVVRNRADGGIQAPLDIVANKDARAICLEQAYLMTVILRAAGFPANVATGMNVHKRGGRPTVTAATGHAEVAVKVGKDEAIIDPTRRMESALSGNRDLHGKDVLTALSEDPDTLISAVSDQDALQEAFADSSGDAYMAAALPGTSGPDAARLLAKGDRMRELATKLGALPEDPQRDFTLAKIDPEHRQAHLEHALTVLDKGLALPGIASHDRAASLMAKLEVTMLLDKDPSAVVKALRALPGPIQYLYSPEEVDPNRMAQVLGAAPNVGIDFDVPSRVARLVNDESLNSAAIMRLAKYVADAPPATDANATERGWAERLHLEECAANTEDRARVVGELRDTADTLRQNEALAATLIHRRMTEFKIKPDPKTGLISSAAADKLWSSLTDDQRWVLPEIGRLAGVPDPNKWAAGILDKQQQHDDELAALVAIFERTSKDRELVNALTQIAEGDDPSRAVSMSEAQKTLAALSTLKPDPEAKTSEADFQQLTAKAGSMLKDYLFYKLAGDWAQSHPSQIPVIESLLSEKQDPNVTPEQKAQCAAELKAMLAATTALEPALLADFQRTLDKFVNHTATPTEPPDAAPS